MSTTPSDAYNHDLIQLAAETARIETAKAQVNVNQKTQMSTRSKPKPKIIGRVWA